MSVNRVKLWNDNVHPYETTFKGDPIKIPAKGFIEGDLFDMNDLKGQFHPCVWLDNVAKIQDPRSYKMLRLERLGDGPVVADVGYKCMMCNVTLPSERTLSTHVDEAHGEVERLSIPGEDEKQEKKPTNKRHEKQP